MSEHWPISIKDPSGVVRVAGHAKGTPPPNAQTVQVATVNVSRAQLLNFTQPVVIVPGVAAKMIVPLGGMLEYVVGTTPYTDHGCDITVYWNTGNGLLFNDQYFSIPGAGFWDQAASQVAPIVPNNPYPVRGGWSAFTDHDLAIGSHSVVGSPTLGNGRLVVTVFYCLVAVSA